MNWAQRTGIGLLASGAVTLAGGCYSAIDSAETLKELSLQRPRQASYEKQVDYYIKRGHYSSAAAIASAPLAGFGLAFLTMGIGGKRRNGPEQLELPFVYNRE